ncbi:hypothetical protein T458_05340 [Brevibacillus panacihumi W25]|uniref:Beta sliding clamp n=1 Tax=Brevibacillus panacihumi W25 TaxID=1408254 RepID=V6MCX3_9BACL|nr:DNA polymerase III subunit beta [Brevibacillus panacihumi]EST55755.1 hypothetical protein T458_05340 [Brevibacillus panacihumi W25]
MAMTMVKREIVCSDSQGFAAALSKAMKAVATSTSIPILTGIHIHAEGECITITGSDDKTMVRIVQKSIGKAIGSDPVSFVVPGRLFTEIIRKLPPGEMKLQIEENKVLIQASKSSFELKTMPVDEYPLRSSNPYTVSFEVEGSLFMKGLSSMYAASTNDMRPVLKAVCLSGAGNKLSFVSTDSHRLSQIHIVMDEEVDTFMNVLIPSTSANEMIKLLKDEAGKVHVQCNDGELRISVNGITFSTRLIEGTFPDTKRIIPQDFTLQFTLNREELFGSLERVNIMAQESKNKTCFFHLVSSGTIPSLNINAMGEEVGKVKEQVFIADFKGEELKFAINAKYFVDALRNMSSKKITILGNGATSPFIIRPVEDDKDLALVLPVRMVS